MPGAVLGNKYEKETRQRQMKVLGDKIVAQTRHTENEHVNLVSYEVYKEALGKMMSTKLDP